jgi:type II secretory pathway pseudopilin PulG
MTQAIDLVKRNARVAVLAAIIVVLVVVAFVFYLGQPSAAEQKTLEIQVKVAQNNLKSAQDQYDVAKLQAEKDSFSGSPGFPATFPSVDLSAYIAGAADKYGVELVSLNPRGATGTETVGGQQYVRNETNVQVTGDYEAMNSFLSYLEAGQAGQFPSLRLANASFTPTGGTFTVVILTQS